MVSEPSAAVVPVPVIVPPVQSSVPATSSVPAPSSVPPVIVRPPPIEDAEASDNVSLPILIDETELVVRLLTESVAPVLSVTMPPGASRSMTASSPGPGTLFPSQLVATPQFPPKGAMVVFQSIVDRTIRSSRPSINGFRPRDLRRSL